MNILEELKAVRQNHAIEHATLQVLSSKHPDIRLVGRSDPQGFVVYGRIDTMELADAVTEALSLLQSGNSNLAIHPNCGTNIGVMGVLAGVFALAASRGKKSLWDAIPAAIVAATLGLLLGRPLGPMVQEKVTTSADVENVKVKEVKRQDVSGVVRHRVVLTRD
jgi:hypothetical protein